MQALGRKRLERRDPGARARMAKYQLLDLTFARRHPFIELDQGFAIQICILCKGPWRRSQLSAFFQARAIAHK